MWDYLLSHRSLSFSLQKSRNVLLQWQNCNIWMSCWSYIQPLQHYLTTSCFIWTVLHYLVKDILILLFYCFVWYYRIPAVTFTFGIFVYIVCFILMTISSIFCSPCLFFSRFPQSPLFYLALVYSSSASLQFSFFPPCHAMLCLLFPAHFRLRAS